MAYELGSRRCECCGSILPKGHWPFGPKQIRGRALYVGERWVTDGRVAFRREKAAPAWAYLSAEVARGYFGADDHELGAKRVQEAEANFDALRARTGLVKLNDSGFRFELPAGGLVAIFRGPAGLCVGIDQRYVRAFWLGELWYEAEGKPLANALETPDVFVMEVMLGDWTQTAFAEIEKLVRAGASGQEASPDA